MGTNGADLAQDERCGFQTVNAIKNSHAGDARPAAPVAGVDHYDTDDDLYEIYDAVSGWIEVATALGGAYDGMIVAWIGGYYTNGSNGGYTRVLGTANTVAAVNTLLNASGWYVCDGAAVNQAASTIWSAASRYLPNLTDDRFLMGDTVVAGTGGENTNSHTHAVDVPETESGAPSASNNYANYSPSVVVGADAHTHNFNPASVTSGIASVTENRPVYLGIFYIVKVF